MNTYPLSILASFIFGIASAIFFIHINSINDTVLSKRDTAPLLASVASMGIPSSTTTSISAVSASTTTSAITAPKKYEYKLLRDVDLCTLNKLGSQSWQAFQFGGTLETVYGYDEDCKNGKMYDTLDWVLFSRDNQ